MAGRIPSTWMDELYARADIVQVVSQYVTLKRDGQRYWGRCPFHNEKTPSFSVTPDVNLYYCFGCKAGGNVVQFVMEMERLTFPEAARMLGDRLHMAPPDVDEDEGYQQRQSQKEVLFKANKMAAQYYHSQLWTAAGKPVLDYWYRRGLDDATIRKFGLGASLETWDDLTQHLMKEGFTEDQLRLAGLTVVKGDHRYDMFRGRAMFPIINLQGEVLGFGGRAMGDQMPKYLNTADTPVFNKRLGVYAINLLKKIRNLPRIILVEGYMDVVALTQAGVEGVVATLGTSLTPEQARLLKRFAPVVDVAYDGDSAGQHAIERALTIFEQEQIPARVLVFPDKLDPDEYVRQRGMDAFRQLRPMSAVSYQMLRFRENIDLSTQDGRTEYAKQCAVLLAKVREPVELENYLEALTVQTGFSREVLLAQMGINNPAPRDNIPRKRESSFAKRLEVSEDLRAEQTLLSLMAYAGLAKDIVKADEFTDPIFRSLAEGLLRGESPSALIAAAEDEQTRAVCGQVFTLLTQEERENATVIAEDCLRVMKMSRLKQQLDTMTDRMKNAQDANERAAALQEVMTLSKELTRMKAAGVPRTREEWSH